MTEAAVQTIRNLLLQVAGIEIDEVVGAGSGESGALMRIGIASVAVTTPRRVLVDTPYRPRMMHRLSTRAHCRANTSRLITYGPLPSE